MSQARHIGQQRCGAEIVQTTVRAFRLCEAERLQRGQQRDSVALPDQAAANGDGGKRCDLRLQIGGDGRLQAGAMHPRHAPTATG